MLSIAVKCILSRDYQMTFTIINTIIIISKLHTGAWPQGRGLQDGATQFYLGRFSKLHVTEVYRQHIAIHDMNAFKIIMCFI